MKKVTLWSLFVTAALFVINLLCGNLFGFIFGYPLPGGEVISYIGFGVLYSEFYPMLGPGETSPGRSYRIVPEPVTLILTFLVLFLVGAVVYLIVKGCRKTKKNTD